MMSKLIPLIIILIGLILLAFAIKLSAKPEEERYDERQIAARGKAYRYAFLITLWSALLYAIVINFITEQPIAQEGVIPALIALLGVGVFGVISIVNDAFLAINKKPAPFFIIFASAAVSNGVSAVLNIIDGDIIQDGLLAYPVTQLGCAVLFTVIMIVLAVKLARSKKPEAEE